MATAKWTARTARTHTPTQFVTVVDGRHTYEVKLWQQHEQSWAAIVKRNGGQVQFYKERTRHLLLELLNLQYGVDFLRRMNGGAE